MDTEDRWVELLLSSVREEINTKSVFTESKTARSA